MCTHNVLCVLYCTVATVLYCVLHCTLYGVLTVSYSTAASAVSLQSSSQQLCLPTLHHGRRGEQVSKHCNVAVQCNCNNIIPSHQLSGRLFGVSVRRSSVTRAATESSIWDRSPHCRSRWVTNIWYIYNSLICALCMFQDFSSLVSTSLLHWGPVLLWLPSLFPGCQVSTHSHQSNYVLHSIHCPSL